MKYTFYKFMWNWIKRLVYFMNRNNDTIDNNIKWPSTWFFTANPNNQGFAPWPASEINLKYLLRIIHALNFRLTNCVKYNHGYEIMNITIRVSFDWCCWLNKFGGFRGQKCWLSCFYILWSLTCNRRFLERSRHCHFWCRCWDWSNRSRCEWCQCS